MGKTRYRSVPRERQGRRYEMIYLALTEVRPREIIKLLGEGERFYGESNGFLGEIAWIIDERLREELMRQKALEVTSAISNTELIYRTLQGNMPTIRDLGWSHSKQGDHIRLKRLTVAISEALIEDARQRAEDAKKT